MREIIVIAHNIRSSHNVGSIIRTCEGLGVDRLILSGYSPFLKSKNDPRLPHIANKVDSAIRKTALGAEKYLAWSYSQDIFGEIEKLKSLGFTIAGLEQTPGSIGLDKFKRPGKLALILGNELTGIEPEILAVCDTVIEIPMMGQKESFNVVQAAAMALYALTSQ